MRGSVIPRVPDDVEISSDADADALLFGSAWPVDAGGILSYSFPLEGALWADYGEGGEPYQGFFPLGEGARDAVRWALSQWGDVVGLQFIELDESPSQVGDLRIAFTAKGMDASQLGYTYAPNEKASGGDVWLNAQLKDELYGSFSPGDLSSFVLLHELGHSLGLKHPHAASDLNYTTLAAQEDSLFNSAMSYFAWPEVLLTRTSIDRLPTTPMALDIDALQRLYGVNTTARSGDDVYRYAADGKYFQTIYDTGGGDTIEVSGARVAKIDLRPDAWSEIGLPIQIDGNTIERAETIHIYRTTLVENARGGDGDDVLIGNDSGNRLQGNLGNDTIEAGPGADSIDGGAGSDWVMGGAGADVFVFSSIVQREFDRVRDFSEADLLAFDTGVFTSLQGVQASNLAFGRAHDMDDYLIYKTGRKILYYDADGTGSEFARIKIVSIKGADAKHLAFQDMLFL